MPTGYRLEYASSARAKCNGPKPCRGTKIEKGELRFGTWLEVPNSSFPGSFKWRHYGCITPKIFANLRKEFTKPDQVDGFDEELRPEDQQRFGDAFESGELAADDVTEVLRPKTEDEQEDGEEKPKKRKRSPKKKNESEVADGDEDEKPKKKAAPKKKKVKKSVSDEEDDKPSSEVEDKKPTKGRKSAPRVSGRNAGKSRKSLKEDSDSELSAVDDDDEEDFKPETPEKKKASKKKAGSSSKANGDESKSKKRVAAKSKETIESDEDAD